MSEENIYLNIFLILMGFLWVVVAFYSTREGAGKFSIMGVVTPETTKSQESWMRSHEAIKKPLILFGLLLIIYGISSFIASYFFDQNLLVVLGRIVLCFNIPFSVYCYFKANGIAKKI